MTKRLAAKLVLAVGLLATGAEAKKPAIHVLYDFSGGDNGQAPSGGLVMDDQGNLFGPASGGARRCQCGVIYELADGGTFTVLHSFSGEDAAYHQKDDGDEPRGSLVRDAKGNLFGSTFQGGEGFCYSYGCGTVFSLSVKTGKEKLLHVFPADAGDGSTPLDGVLLDNSGNIYGVTEGGGSVGGVVYKIAPDGSASVPLDFAGGADGKVPAGDLIQDTSGNIYGTTAGGGTSCGENSQGCGTVFKLAPDGSHTPLYAFKGGTGDGADPQFALTMDAKGDLYGTTQYGGQEMGTVFKLAPDGSETLLHVFTGGSDGKTPESALFHAPDGNFYGVTELGGDAKCNCGTIYMIKPNGRESIVHAFKGGADGAFPVGTLIADAAGSLYGVASSGGACTFYASGCGLIYRLDFEAKGVVRGSTRRVSSSAPGR